MSVSPDSSHKRKNSVRKNSVSPGKSEDSFGSDSSSIASSKRSPRIKPSRKDSSM